MIAKVHDYYLFPFLPPIFILTAYGASNLFASKKLIIKCFTLTLLMIIPITAFLRANPRWNTESPGFNVEYLNNKIELQNLIKNDDKIIIGPDKSRFILLYYVNKKGWVFDTNPEKSEFEKWISYGAKYLYTDSNIDTLKYVKEYLDEKIYDKNALKVFRLKSQK